VKIAPRIVLAVLLSGATLFAAPAATDAYLVSIEKDLGDGYGLFWEAVDAVFAAQKLGYSYASGALLPTGAARDSVYEAIPVAPLARSCLDAPKTRWPALIRDYLVPALAAPKAIEPVGLDFEAVKGRLFPEFVAERLLPPESRSYFVAKSGIPGIMMLLAVDRPEGKIYLNRADAARWGKDFEALFALARENLLSSLGEKATEIKLRGRTVFAVRSGTSFTASLAYFAGSKEGWLGEKGMLFIMPSKDWLIFAPIGRDNGFDLVYDLYALARSLSAPSPDSLSAQVYWTDGVKVKELGLYFLETRIVVTLPEELKPYFKD
jgi:hypothetical protein